VLVEKKYCYRYRITPDVAFNNAVRFGICPHEIFDRPDSELWRLMKVDYVAGAPVLTRPPEVDVSDFLPCTAGSQASLLSRVLQYASKHVIRPLFAQTGTRLWGGMINDLSDLFWGKEILFQAGAAGDAHACMLDTGGAAYCWGYNGYGQLGTGTTASSNVPAKVAGGHVFAGISAGSLHTCAWTAAGRGYCWGFGSNGALGNGGTGNSTVPVQVHGITDFVEISVGHYFSCGRTASGPTYCWGYNRSGSLGSGDREPASVPTQVQGGLTFRSITAGLTHSCGLLDDGAAYCWGGGSFGALGTGDRDDRLVPAPVNTELRFARLMAGSGSTCGVTAGGTAYCWGTNFFGSLGHGSTAWLQQVFVPAAVVGGHSFAQAGEGNANNIHTSSCGITTGGTAYCWGSNALGQLGTTAAMETCEYQGSPFPCTGTPTAVQGGQLYRSIHPAGAFTCGITVDGSAYCWGIDNLGQLGSGGTAAETCSYGEAQVRCSRTPLRVGGTP
jgi:alpha-tubulin suppressor-like RCC1 family protein